MANAFTCITKKATQGIVNKKRVDDLEAIMKDLDNPDIQERVRIAGQILRYRYKRQQKQIELQVQKLNEINTLANEVRNGDNSKIVVIPKVFEPRKIVLAMMSKLTYDPTGNFRGPNVEISWKRIKGEAEALFSSGLEKFHRTHLGLKQDKAAIADFVKEVFGEDSGSPAAKAFAEAWGNTDDFLVRSMQKHGGTIFKNKRWGLPQLHDSKRISNNSSKEWIEFIKPRLNREVMIDDTTGRPFTDKSLDTALEGVYETLSTSGISKLQPGGQRVGRKLANRHQDPRFLHFKNSQAWTEYNEKFGSGGDVFEIMTGHIDQYSREIAILENLGPDPEATISYMQDHIKTQNAKVSQENPLESPKDSAGLYSVEKVYDILSGRINAPVTAWWAEGNQFTRNILASAQLAGAFITATTDINFGRITAQFNGLSASRQMNHAMKQFFSGVTGRDAQRLATRLLLGAEQWSGTAIGQQRFLGEVTGPRTSRMVADVVMRGSLLTPWTYANRHAFKQEVLMNIAENRTKAFKELDPAFRKALERYEIDSPRWNALTKQIPQEH